MKLDGWKKVGNSHARALAMEAVLYISSSAGTLSAILPHEYDRDGYPIPNFVFRGLAGAFHGFIVCVIFAFTCSLCALLTANKSSLSRLFFYSALVSTASAAAILVFAASSGIHGKSMLIPEISTASLGVNLRLIQ